MLPNPFSSSLPSLARPATSTPGMIYGAAFAPLGAFGGGTSSHQQGAFWGRYVRRLFSPQQWDLDAAFWTITTSLRSPSQVYKLTLHRKQTKNVWARDDPAVVGVLLGFLAVISIAYGLAYRYVSPLAYLYLISQSWFSFFGFGLFASGATWALVNARCRIGAGGQAFSVEQKVELLYSWDVHCNAFVSVFFYAYLCNFLLLPITMGGKANGDGIFQCALGNSLYAAAVGHYLYGVFQGYMGQYRYSACSEAVATLALSIVPCFSFHSLLVFPLVVRRCLLSLVSPSCSAPFPSARQAAAAAGGHRRGGVPRNAAYAVPHQRGEDRAVLERGVELMCSALLLVWRPASSDRLAPCLALPCVALRCVALPCSFETLR